jgi:hypothetical protein
MNLHLPATPSPAPAKSNEGSWGAIQPCQTCEEPSHLFSCILACSTSPKLSPPLDEEGSSSGVAVLLQTTVGVRLIKGEQGFFTVPATNFDVDKR